MERFLFVILISMSCCSPMIVKKKSTHTCFDYESCYRSCYFNKNKYDCKIMGENR